MRESHNQNIFASLAPHEKVILNLVCEGYSNKEIAKQLKIGELTARNYVLNIMHKANCKNRTQLAVEYCIYKGED
jgi:DNA-binding NarL/FixJ family response regulator